jgi:hypothetical protein
MAEDPNSRGGRLAQRLDTLFRTVHPPGKKEYSNDAVAEAITAAGVKVRARTCSSSGRVSRTIPAPSSLRRWPPSSACP